MDDAKQSKIKRKKTHSFFTLIFLALQSEMNITESSRHIIFPFIIHFVAHDCYFFFIVVVICLSRNDSRACIYNVLGSNYLQFGLLWYRLFCVQPPSPIQRNWTNENALCMHQNQYERRRKRNINKLEKKVPSITQKNILLLWILFKLFKWNIKHYMLIVCVFAVIVHVRRRSICKWLF